MLPERLFIAGELPAWLIADGALPGRLFDEGTLAGRFAELFTGELPTRPAVRPRVFTV